MTTQREAMAAREAGRQARRGGTPFGLCPYRHPRDAAARIKADEWRMGWDEQDRALKRQQTAGA